jgi:hypothetical protein
VRVVPPATLGNQRATSAPTRFGTNSPGIASGRFRQIPPPLAENSLLRRRVGQAPRQAGLRTHSPRGARHAISTNSPSRCSRGCRVGGMRAPGQRGRRGPSRPTKTYSAAPCACQRSNSYMPWRRRAAQAGPTGIVARTPATRHLGGRMTILADYLNEIARTRHRRGDSRDELLWGAPDTFIRGYLIGRRSVQSGELRAASGHHRNGYWTTCRDARRDGAVRVDAPPFKLTNIS